ncbi:neural cell adhesion molecule 1 isoform X2 [Folsomia candida]|nr:neural cell adhesion molecule 1 isoform X2 [Folsomia candida]
MPLGSGTRLTLTPNERTVKKFSGDTYVISCINGASDTQWFAPNGAKINDTKISRVRQQLRRGGGGIDLFLQRVTLEESGHYTCRSKATNVTFNFVVIKPITFDTSLAHQTALEQTSFMIKCTATGQSSTPKLYWKVDGKSPQGPKFKVVKDGLVVTNVTKSDAKRSYVCHAMDIDSPMPDVKSLNIMLHVARKPMEIADKSTTSEKWSVIGDWANFTCKIDSDPIPSFEWFGPSSQRLVFNDEISIINDILNGSFYSSTLQVRLSRESQFGNYVCRGGNDIGAVERTFTLRKSVKPSTPFLELERVAPQHARIRVMKYKPLPGEDSILVSNKSVHELPLLDYQVETKLAQDSVFYSAKHEPYEQGFILLQLLPGTTYHVRAALKNALGSGHFSPPIQITTTETSSSTTSPPIPDEPQRINRRPKTPKPTLCPPSLFQCTSGECLSYAAKCNSIVECQDASDEEPEMCRIALSTSSYPSNIIDATEPAPAASRSVSSQTLPKSPLYTIPSRRLFYINGPNSLSSSNLSSKLSIPPKTLPPPPPQKTVVATSPAPPSISLSSDEDEQEGEVSSASTESLGIGPNNPPTSPNITTTNETSVQVTKNSDNTTTKRTTNTLTTITKMVGVGDRGSKVVNTKTEIVITEIIEINEL